MSDSTDVIPDTDPVAVAGSRRGTGPALQWTLVALTAVALLVVAGTVGWLIRGGSGSGGDQPSAVDIGFAQDMAVHHTQAVTMAGYERDNTSSPQMKVLAFDIESSQQFQIGEMSGWLDVWGDSRNNPHPMVWMGAEHADHIVDGLMPGMATPTQMNTLESLHGKQLDIMFLQLMIHHHQGGIPMAQYAEQHAREPYVQLLAAQMVAAQNNEIIQMEQLLRQLGAAPLPAPQT